MVCAGQELGETVESAVRQYFEQGVALEDIKGMTAIAVERMRICLDVYEHMEQDPTLDIRSYLRHVHHRSISQIHRDEQMLDIVLSYLMTNQRKRSEFIVRKQAEKMIRIGDQSGDWRPIKEGTKTLMDLDRLGEPESKEDDIQNTAKLPYVLSPIEGVNPNAHSLSEEARQALFDKWGASEDEKQRLIKDKVRERLMAFTMADAEDVKAEEIEHE